ncbi:putative diguanylate cyclase [Salmonella enterica subsp. enterica serovar Nchanga str. CFSAN001091]|nr:putative diguanylate cyclase [Salmonella enterica subsp. enterica serovar Nchanga str. CFSAN001091]
MRVSRSLTIKQMAMVAAVVMVFVFVFCTVLLFHLVQQNRYNTATQLESIARSVREPLSSAILKADLPGAETILESIKPAGVVSRADVVLPNQFQALRKRFIPERPVPVMVTRLFELPVQISLPFYSLERLFAGASRQSATAGLPCIAGGFVPYVQVRHERALYVSDHLLTFIADPDGGHRLVRKPPDCASAAQNRPRAERHSAAGADRTSAGVAASASG